MTSDDVCAVIGPQMWIAGEEGKYTEMLERHKSQKTSGIMMQESIYEQVEPLRRIFVLFVCISSLYSCCWESRRKSLQMKNITKVMHGRK